MPQNQTSHAGHPREFSMVNKGMYSTPSSHPTWHLLVPRRYQNTVLKEPQRNKASHTPILSSRETQLPQLGVQYAGHWPGPVQQHEGTRQQEEPRLVKHLDHPQPAEDKTVRGPFTCKQPPVSLSTPCAKCAVVYLGLCCCTVNKQCQALYQTCFCAVTKSPSLRKSGRQS